MLPRTSFAMLRSSPTELEGERVLGPGDRKRRKKRILVHEEISPLWARSSLADETIPRDSLDISSGADTERLRNPTRVSTGTLVSNFRGRAAKSLEKRAEKANISDGLVFRWSPTSRHRKATVG